MDITRRLARYVVTSESANIPQSARREAVRSLVNWLGCAVGGAHHDAVSRTLVALEPYQALPHATVLGRRERLDLMHAALVNGISSHVFDFDDTHLRTLLHASVAVAPALFALAEQRRLSGAQFLDAFILGVEVESRIANTIYTNHNSDWYITGTVGPFGAAAAVGKVLGLNEESMVHALGIAAIEGAGLREVGGTMAKALVHGRAAQNGLYAALLAAQGFTSSTAAIEAPRGFARVVGAAADTSAMLERWGEPYEIESNTYKPYACGVVAHPVIDGCMRLRAAHALQVNDIRSVTLGVHPQALKLTGVKAPSSGLDSKWSIYHSAAVALARGAAGEHEYTDECVNDPGVSGLRARVAASADLNLRQDEAHVSVDLADGRRLECHVDHAVGSVDNPMSNADLDVKFIQLVEPVLRRESTQKLLKLCWRLAELEDAAAVVRAAVPG